MEITNRYYPKNRSEWRRWLQKNHAKKKEIWLIYDRKHKNASRVTYQDALDEALCFGWIDGQVKGVSEGQYAQRFTPRREKSAWSELNIKHYQRLLKGGFLHEAGKRAYAMKHRVYDPKSESELYAIRDEFKKRADPQKALRAMSFFKTKKGEYGSGDIFLGLTVPETRSIAKQHRDMALSRVEHLLQVGKHEERLCALFILVDRYRRAEKNEQEKIFNLYLKNLRKVNNWDLVDASAHYIIGAHLEGKSKKLLYRLASSKSLWDRRIAMVSTWHDIRKGKTAEAFKIADMLLFDTHDLIHKAVGWMLRETGKYAPRARLTRYVTSRATRMPRTALRYAIEHYPKKDRSRFLLMR